MVFYSGDRIIDEVPLLAAESVGEKVFPSEKEEQESGLFSRLVKKIKDFFKVSEVN